MRKTFITTVVSLALARTLPVPEATATVYSFNFDLVSQNLDVSGQMTVNSQGEITAISGQITGGIDQTITGVVTDPNGASPASSPDGQFIYDNLYYAGKNPLFDVDGLLFTTAQNPSGYWNLWGNGPDNYSLWESKPGAGYPVQATTGGVVVNVGVGPEPSTWAMLLLGFASLGYASFRRPGNRARLTLPADECGLSLDKRTR